MPQGNINPNKHNQKGNMARIAGLLNPKNAVESTGGSKFKEGNVLINSSFFKVVPARRDKEGNIVSNQGQPDQPKLSLVWNVTRLDEDLEPMHDEHDNPLTEDLAFGLGGKALAKAHPGNASSPDDDDVEDLGTDENTTGNTVFVADETFRINSKSAIAILMKSLEQAGWPAELLDRVWAPDYEGAIFWMKNQVADEKMERTDKDGKKVEQEISYKVVGKIVREPGKGKGKKASGKAATGKKDEGKAEGGNEIADLALATLKQIAADNAGETLTKKALALKVQTTLQKAKTDAKMLLPVVKQVKDDSWLEEKALEVGALFDGENITFGE